MRTALDEMHALLGELIAELPVDNPGAMAHTGVIGWIVGAESAPCGLPGMGRVGGQCNRSWSAVRGQARSCP